MEKQGIHAVIINKEGKEFDTWLPPVGDLPDALIIQNTIFVRSFQHYLAYKEANTVFPVAAQYVVASKPDVHVQLAIAGVEPGDSTMGKRAALAVMPPDVATVQQGTVVPAVEACEPCGKPVCESLPGQMTT